MWHVRGKTQVCTEFGRKIRERDHLEELGVDGRIILKWIFKKCEEGMSYIDVH